MSNSDRANSPFTSRGDSCPPLLASTSLSAAPHDSLAISAHQSPLNIDLDCISNGDAALNSPENQIPLADSRDQLFGDIEHVGDHVKEGHIAMVEALEPPVDSQSSPDSSQELKRVKVYKLIDSVWVDQGTAYCFGQLDESNQAFLIARSEADFEKVILSTAIRSNDVYQRQQDSLIVWTEPDGADYALSFQDAEGCVEVWNFIIEVQHHLNTEDQGLGSSPPSGDHSAITATFLRTHELPSPQFGNIQDVESAIKALTPDEYTREKLCEDIQCQGYIKSLIDLMHMAEDLESLDNLHALCSLMQTILMTNDHGIYEHIVGSDIFFGVVGMLEYDLEFPTHKANYREFLHNNSRFHQPILIHDEHIRKKVHHTYRLQFLKDVVLARALDDSTFNVLNSCILYNQIDIINHVQQNPPFLQEIVRLYVSEEVLVGPRKDDEYTDTESMDTSGKSYGSLANGRQSPTSTAPFTFDPPGPLTESDVAFRREVVILIQQLCAMGKNVQLPARMALFRTLVDRGVLFAVQWTFGLDEKEEVSKVVINAAGEILSALLDHDLHGVRGHVHKQAIAIERENEAGRIDADRAETLLKVLCRVMTQSRDFAVQCQVGDALKALLDISQNPAISGVTPAILNARMSARPKDDPSTEKFLEYFYKNAVDILLKPLHDIPDFRKQTDQPVLKLSRERTNLLLYLCDLLCIFAQQHMFRSHFYILSSDISTRVATLLSARDKHLRLSALRFFRICLKLNNKNLLSHLMKLDVFEPLLDLALQELHRDSLLSASCLEFFEHMRWENMKDLINHCMTKHETLVRQLAKTPIGDSRFKAFILRWEINVEPPPKEALPEGDPKDSRRTGQTIDFEEEDYFNADDDDSSPPPPPITLAMLGGVPRSIFGIVTPRRREATVRSKAFRPQSLVLPRTPPLPSLVDYGDEDDDIDPSAPEHSHDSSQEPIAESSTQVSTDVPPSPRLSHRQIPRPSSPPRRRSLDEDDNTLEMLARSEPLKTPCPTSIEAGSSPKATPPSLRLAAKRRRDDDDETEPLERLASKSKRTEADFQRPEEPAGGQTRPVKQNGDPSKRMKVTFCPSIITMTQRPSSPVPSETGAKDGDIG